MKAYSLLAVLPLVIASGCDRRLSDEAVASVDGAVYTRAALERDVEIIEKLQSLAGFSGRVPMNFDAMLEALGPQATAFRNNLKKDALSAKMERILKEQIAVSLSETSKSDLEERRREALEFNRGLEAANRSLARLATNSWKSIRAGNDFAVVGQALVKMQKGIAFEPVFRDAYARKIRELISAAKKEVRL